MYLSTGLFFILDRFLKYQSLHAWAQPALINKYLGWMPYLNPGIGFGLPVPNWLIIVLTIPIIVLLIYLLINNRHQLANNLTILQFNNFQITSFLIPYSLFLIFTGSISNFTDRVLYAHTIDYLLTITSLYNLADVMIVAGFAIYIITTYTLYPKR